MWCHVTCGPAHILLAVLWGLFEGTDVLSWTLTANIMTVEELQKMDRQLRVRRTDRQPTGDDRRRPTSDGEQRRGSSMLLLQGQVKSKQEAPSSRLSSGSFSHSRQSGHAPFQPGQTERTRRCSYIAAPTQDHNRQVVCVAAGHVTWAVAPGLVLTSTQSRKKHKSFKHDFT